MVATPLEVAVCLRHQPTLRTRQALREKQEQATAWDPVATTRMHACIAFAFLFSRVRAACFSLHTLPCGATHFHVVNTLIPHTPMWNHTLPCGKMHALVKVTAVQDGAPCAPYPLRTPVPRPCGTPPTPCTAVTTAPAGRSARLPALFCFHSCALCDLHAPACTHNAIPLCRLCVVVCGPTPWSLVRAQPLRSWTTQHHLAKREGGGGDSMSSFCQADRNRTTEYLFREAGQVAARQLRCQRERPFRALATLLPRTAILASAKPIAGAG